MPLYLQDLYDRLTGFSGQIPYTDESEFPSSFPYTRWNIQAQRYKMYWNHFTGEVWNEVIPDEKDEDGHDVLRYPLQINIVKTACVKQNAVLFGETSDTVDSLVPMRVKPRIKPGEQEASKAEIILAQELEEFINRVWAENGASAIMQENGLMSQFLGGCVFRLGFKPNDPELEYSIRIELLPPDMFMPVWDTGHPDDLLEAWVVYRVPAREASLRYGFDLSSGALDPLYIEHWTKDEYSVLLGGQPLVQEIGGQRVVFQHLKNPFGFVPFVYIPRRRVGNYYGLSMIDDLDGLAREINSRIADLGDIIRDIAQREVYLRNTPSVIKPRTYAGGQRSFVDLGNQAPGMEKPEAFVVNPPPLPEGLAKFPEVLSEQFGNDSSVPPIAYGKDEGSQRSALTLAVRFWPITSEARSQRNHWRVALKRIAWMISRIAIVKRLGGITEAHLKNKDMGPEWASMIPRDRELMLNEINTMLTQKGLDPITALEKLDLVEDPTAVYKKAQEHFTWLFNLEAKAAAGGAGPGGDAHDAGDTKPPMGGKSNNSEMKAPTAQATK